MKKVIYEHPLNERIRNLLRLEYLLAGLLYHIKGPTEWDSRAVIKNLIEILDFTNRFDYKIELTKQLELHALVLERWQRTPQIDTDRLADLITQTQTLTKKLGKIEQTLEQSYSQHQLIQLMRQRSTIAGGNSRCDLPGYYYWLQKNPKQRQKELNEWLIPLEPLRCAIDFVLYLLRNHAATSNKVALSGFYQTQLDINMNYQLIQVALPLEHPCFPEVKGGKQRITIHFLETAKMQTMQTEQDVHFELTYCMA